MISICIPVYNFDVTPLVRELLMQAKLLTVPYEIILIDDCSGKEYKSINAKVCEKEVYIQLAENIGRAKIRNLFLSYTQYDNLLFLDCDSLVVRNDFLQKYIDVINQRSYNVVCGGRVYDLKRPERSKMLRWKYGIGRESQPVEVRRRFPNKSFMTSNFLINRKILASIRFDERIRDYGHEDTLFGYALKLKGIPIDHIDNPILNGDLEDNWEYLAKTEKGIVNLLHILDFVNYEEDFINDVSLLRFYSKVKRFKKMIGVIFLWMKPLIKLLLARGFVNLFLFDFYKLGFLVMCQRRAVVNDRI
ncbi:MAG: glycosyltransferase family 2 protein [Bacteroidales bacterium]|nr:MAG: glycosyltransferase family 2 protein [Bacteroidales bacterium]